MDHTPGVLLEPVSVDSKIENRCLVILNQPLQQRDTFEAIWTHASTWICADGGANRLHDLFEGACQGRRSDFLPTAIVGDLDSLRQDVRQFYATKGVQIHEDADQYSTDLAKCMRFALSSPWQSPTEEVILLGSLSGRLDHAIGLLHEMMREAMRTPELRIWLFSDISISFILKAGVNRILLPQNHICFTPNVGILPLYGPAKISTRGLEWNVTGWETSMGGQVSTSNHVVEDSITVDSDACVLFTIERRDGMMR
ncbi:thiamine pyrophosphokinase [Pseudovirgaria hyperparasitica]|uniref:Thiamine pyrophosphokinase n=1 Tax=Pseudovirgaria hyperparasitica TaxID=470096 RepID=A0A6A6WD90_9PEZI|nr:thiamine pyrophosphokinase [Pseudovirgaria hyperparasitica]KAF2760673.1 thiamine pyrophosphokinase [Pseudovirgaria hyperparasitica]